ncbi:MAG: malate dehydrogenase [candidate division Zixibacteria bacterium]|jgi:malate dehydrogenase|nr:malate dehydrogenase [candidate division Zixibacteria bacterium]
MRRKVTVIGAGNVGAAVAQYLAEDNLCDIMLIDVIEGLPQGKALDLVQAGPIRGYDVTIKGSNDFADMRGSDIVVHTAGLARKPGMSREDLQAKNAEIVGSVAAKVKEYASNAIILMVANPLDVMTYHAYKVSGFPPNRVFGQAGILDSIRFRTFIGMELGVAQTETEAMVLGGHGDTMVPLPRYTTASGIPITELMSAERIEALSQRTIKGGGEIVALLKTGSAYYAPAAATVAMVDSVLNDKKKLYPCSAYLTGQYGISNIYIGVPAILGQTGVEKIIELKLAEKELKALQESAATYTKQLKELGY